MKMSKLVSTTNSFNNKEVEILKGLLEDKKGYYFFDQSVSETKANGHSVTVYTIAPSKGWGYLVKDIFGDVYPKVIKEDRKMEGDITAYTKAVDHVQSGIEFYKLWNAGFVNDAGDINYEEIKVFLHNCATILEVQNRYGNLNYRHAMKRAAAEGIDSEMVLAILNYKNSPTFVEVK